MSTRKRPQAFLPEDNEEDELSPTKNNSGKTDVFESNKKRKLNTSGSSPMSRNSGTRRSVLGQVAGYLFGRGKENVQLPEEEVEDELIGDGDGDGNEDPGEEKEEVDIYDVPDDEDVVTPKRRSGRPPNVGKSSAKKARIEEAPKEDDVWEVKSLDAEENLGKIKSARRSISTPLASRQQSIPKSSAAMRITEAEKREKDPTPKRGRLKKDAEEEQDSLVTMARGKKLAKEESLASTEQSTGRRRPRKSDIVEEDNAPSNNVAYGMEDADPEELEPAPVRRRSGRAAKSQVEDVTHADEETVPEPRRQGRPKTLIDSAKTVPKGILTPTKDRSERPRKSVVFESHGSIDLGFKDLPKYSGKKELKNKTVKPTEHLEEGFPAEEVPKSKKPAKKKAIEVVPSSDAEADTDDGADEAACAVCQGLKSKKPNQIIFCDGDGCGYAAHQKCHEPPLSVVPEGNWFCRKCQSKLEEVSRKSNKSAKKGEVIPSSDVEDNTDDSEEAACTLCRGFDSKKGNKIVLCDKCDRGFHQKCHGITVIPEEEWFCKDCESEVQDVEVTSDIPEIEGLEEHLQSMQRLLLDRLTGQKQMKLHGHDEEMQKVHQVVQQTVLAGEGNSMLIIGARGCGKTTLVESVISDLSDYRNSFHVVRLNGFIHTDDKLALKEIWRQLGREMEVEDDSKINVADTLASLLALLSHPSEISGDEDGQTAKSVVFILDEFDLFTTHSRQTLLYNLFDIAQARKAPIVVLGLTTRVDVVEALEKRVKSRFSHRYVHLSLPRSIPTFWETCKDGLIATKEDLGEAGTDVESAGLDDFVSFWKTMIDDLYAKDNLFKHHLKSHFYRTKSVSGFFTSCIFPVVNLSAKNPVLKGQVFMSDAMSLSAPDSKLHILQGLSELELALVIAAARLDPILDADTCNFAMAYDEYCSLTSRHKLQSSSSGMAAIGSGAKVWGRDVALGAWERLVEYCLLVPAAVGGGSARDMGAGGRMWKLDIRLEEIPGSVEGLSSVLTKWCRDI